MGSTTVEPMTAVRRSCAAAFVIGVTAWLLSSVQNDHGPVRILVTFTPTHGLVASDLPRLAIWAVMVALGVRLMR